MSEEKYSNKIKKNLEKNGIKIGDKISLTKENEKQEGILMPKSSGDPDTIVIKLNNGYNIGIDFENSVIKKISSEKRVMKIDRVKEKFSYDPSKKTIVIMHTGGTVASKIDYKTGAAYPAFTPEDLFFAIPELKEIANFRTRVVYQMYSGDMEPEHWTKLAEKIYQEINETNPDGIIVTHGTDTMAYTSAALSFMLQGLKIPIILVGSQRSSDRGSSDTFMNLICASNFIAKTNFSGVALCMHGSMNDDFCLVHSGTHVKKMHSSRRDTFRSIDIMPYAKVHQDGKIDFMRKDYTKSNKGKIELKNKYERNVALIKIHPAIDYRIFEFLENYKGVLLEGTGLGNAPVNVLDKYTKHHQKILDSIKNLVKRGIFVGMVSQSPYGKVNMNVYSYGRRLLKVGVTPLEMTSETAYVKLGWVLGHTKNLEKIKKQMQTNFVGEITERINPRSFLY